MRKQQLTMFGSMLVGMAVAACAQTTSQLDRVNVVRDTDNIRVEMRASGTMTPKLSTLDSPARVVVELPETVMATGQRRIPVGADGVKGVRIGTDGQKQHPTTRVVVDLEKACAYDLTPGPAGKLVLTLHANTVAKSAPETKTVAANVPTEVKAEAPTTSATNDASSPNNFVFVEPSYQAKNEAKKDTAAEEPTARAQEAAARFSDKTAVELIPVSANAAQAQATPVPAITPAVNLAAEQKAQGGHQAAPVGPKYAGEPIPVNLNDVDLKDFFRLIHEISGLNV